MEFFTATGKLKKVFFFLQLEMFDVCTTGDTAFGFLVIKFVITENIMKRPVFARPPAFTKR